MLTGVLRFLKKRIFDRIEKNFFCNRSKTPKFCQRKIHSRRLRGRRHRQRTDIGGHDTSSGTDTEIDEIQPKTR